MTVEATRALAELEQVHGLVRRIPDDSPIVEAIEPDCLTGVRLYMCCGCRSVFSVEPDGDVRNWMVAFRPPEEDE